MDDESAIAVLSLQLEDLNRLVGTSGQAHDHVNEADGRIALISYRDEVAARLHFLLDRRLGRSIARAVLLDESTLRQVRLQENDAIRDRDVACQIGGFRNGPLPTPMIDLTDDCHNSVIARYVQMNTVSSEKTGSQEAVTKAHQGTPVLPVLSKESILGVEKICVSCRESIHYFRAVYAPCGHDYCQDCAKRLFQNSVQDESLFPPRCCRQAIPLAAVDIFMTAEFILFFEEKRVEFSTPNRLYCALSTCSAFIPPAKVKGDSAICPKCSSRVCTMCKGPTHRGRDCPKDEALNALVSTALKEGWKRCNRCKRYVELVQGCNHITCLCRAEFCYVCAQPWKSCLCPVWDEQRLIDRANVVVERLPVPPAPDQRQAVLENVQRNIRDHHECNNHDWQRQSGGDICDGCGLEFPFFIYYCGLCQVLACSVCRHQRF